VKSSRTVTKAQRSFPELCRSKETVSVTRHGEVVAFVVPRHKMEALLEQMEILGNPEAMRAIRQAKRGKGKFHPLSVLDED